MISDVRRLPVWQSAVALLLLTGCGGPTTSDTGTTQQQRTVINNSLTFNIASAETLAALQQAVLPADIASAPDISSRSLARTVSAEALAATNLLAADSDGSIYLAIESTFPVYVQFAAVDPTARYVYIAVDQEVRDLQGYLPPQFLLNGGCGIYRVSTADNSYACVRSDVMVMGRTKLPWSKIEIDAKPLQFDAAGNAYFVGREYSTVCDVQMRVNGVPVVDQNGNAVCEYGQIIYSTGNLIYRVDNLSFQTTQISQDIEDIDSFYALKTGELVFYSANQVAGYRNLKLWRQNRLVDITTTQEQFDSYRVDGDTTILWNHTRFARARAQGGIDHATLDLSMFGGTSNLLETILDKNGRMYARYYRYDSEAAQSTQVIYQVLPADPRPRAVVGALGDFSGAVSIENGFAYAVETRRDANFGYIDHIHVQDMTTRTSYRLFDVTAAQIQAGATQYDIYNWKLDNGRIVFSGLDRTRTMVIMGSVDVAQFVAGAPAADYLTISDVASATGAINEINDLTVVAPQAEVVDDGSQPTASVIVSRENLYSVSLDFSKPMDKDSVRQNISLVDVDGGGAPVDYMPVWIANSLHLVPDADALGFGDLVTTPFAFDRSYTAGITAGATDIFARSIATNSATFTARPNGTWYSADSANLFNRSLASVAAGVASGRVVAKPETYSTAGGSYDNLYDLGLSLANVPNVRIEFSYTTPNNVTDTIHLFNSTRFAANGSTGALLNFTDLQFNPRGSLTFRRAADTMSVNTAVAENAERWRRYRMDIVGTSVTVSASADGVTYSVLSNLSRSDFAGLGASSFRLLLQTQGQVQTVARSTAAVRAMDSLQVSTLTAGGALASTPGNLLNHDFSAGTIDGIPGNGIGLDDDIRASYQ